MKDLGGLFILAAVLAASLLAMATESTLPYPIEVGLIIVGSIVSLTIASLLIDRLGKK